MAPTRNLLLVAKQQDDQLYHKGVKHLYDIGVTKVPYKYILPVSDRPIYETRKENSGRANLNLPVINFAELQGPKRANVLSSLAKACKSYGFFQVINHGIPNETIHSMIDISRRFFELPYEERAKYMSADTSAPVRYGTSFNQSKDGVFYWRDFLKLMCHPLPDVLPHWPTSPLDLRKAMGSFSKHTKYLFLMLMEAVLESLGLVGTADEDDILKEFDDGSQLMIVNCYPPCPEPNLTLGMPPHSDYGFLTLLLQDEVEGLQIQHEGKWLTVEPIPNSFVVNVGDHLEIFSNGRYKSVLHRVLVNSSKPRISVASLHSLPFECTIRPSTKLVEDEANPRRYKDTNFASFLKYISSCEPMKKNFLESRKLT